MADTRDIQRARQARDEAEAHLKEVVAEAVSGGVTLTAAARAAGITAPTVHSWIKSVGEETNTDK